MSVRSHFLQVLMLTGLLIGLVAVLWLTKIERPPHGPWTFEIEMQVSAGTMSQLFWSSALDFTEERSVRVPAPVDGFHPVRFLLPSRGVQWLRFDPTDQPGDMSFGAARLLDEHGIPIRTYDPSSFEPVNQIASVTRVGGITQARTVEGSSDSSFLFPIGCLPASVVGRRPGLVTRTGAQLAGVGFLLLLAACVIAIGRRVLTDDAPKGPVEGRWRYLLGLATLFVLVFSAKLIVLRTYPLTIPYNDQWDAEARALFIPFDACALSWKQMVYFHNEHRIFLTRLLSLNLLFLNGQWDPRLQQVVNAVVHSGTAVVLAALFTTATPRRRAISLFALVALAFATPFDWENTVQGFQSAFYFQVLLAILVIWLLTNGRSRFEWSLGVACAFVGLGTAAGALLAPLAVVIVVLLDLLCDPRRAGRRSLATALAAGSIAAIGWATSSPPLAHHAALKAALVGDFLTALGRNLAWPLMGQPLAAIVLWLPTAALVSARLVRRQALSAADRWTLGLAAWAALQAAAIAYGRGHGGAMPAGRYQDLLSIGFIANTVALLAAVDLAPVHSVRRGILALTLSGWTLAGCFGLARLIEGARRDLAESSVRWSQEASDLRRFVITDDAQVLAGRPPSDLPHPSVDVLIRALRNPFIRRILPAAIRRPIELVPATSSTAGFVKGGVEPSLILDAMRSWGSFSSEGGLGRFESQPLPADFRGFLRFSVVGDFDRQGGYLAFKDTRTGHETAIVRSRSAQVAWRDITIREPSAPYSILAVDSTKNSWVAFSEPVEVGTGSLTAEYAIASSTTLLLVSLMAIAWLISGRVSVA